MTIKVKRRYTKQEAVNAVLGLKKELGTMPNKFDYEGAANIVDLGGLADALEIDRDEVRRLHTKLWAAVNIAVLREIRLSEGREVYIAKFKKSPWETNGCLFDGNHLITE